MNTWFCPVDGLEYRCLVLVGWKEVSRVDVDEKPWAKMQKPIDSPASIRVLN